MRVDGDGGEHAMPSGSPLSAAALGRFIVTRTAAERGKRHAAAG